MATVVDRVERKLLILGSPVVWLVGMLLIASYAGDAVIIAGAFLAALALGSYLQAAYTFTAESFPTRARLPASHSPTASATPVARMGAPLLPVAVGAWSFGAGFAVIGVTGVVAGIVALAGPAATGRHLEQVSV